MEPRKEDFMDLPTLEKLVDTLESVSKLRNRLDRCPNGVAKEALKTILDEALKQPLNSLLESPSQGKSLAEELSRNSQVVSLLKSRIDKDTWVLKISDYMMLVRAEKATSVNISCDQGRTWISPK
jgi:hypothetical protein